MGVILDTSTLIDIERGGGDIRETVGEQDIAVSAITVTELTVGVEKASDDVTKQRRRRFLATVRQVCDVVGYGDRVIAHHARLLIWCERNGVPHSAHDLIIAATAAAEDRTLVTGEKSPTFALPDLEVRRIE